MALAGGVSLQVPQGAGYVYQEGGLLSPDGHCRVFDAKAGGTVFGSGVGVVVLRRLGEGVGGGGRIRAGVKGAAGDKEGAMKVGYTAPDGEAQAGGVI